MYPCPMVELTVSNACHSLPNLRSFHSGSGTVPKNWLVTGSGNSSPRPQRRSIAAIGSMPTRWAKRSEEHTSELQSLMRISYAVFCLKKKQNTKINNPYYTDI